MTKHAEVVAYCPHYGMEARHPYLTYAPNRKGSTWVCEPHAPKERAKIVNIEDILKQHGDGTTQ